MIFHMKTTLIISDHLFAGIKALAAKRRRTLSNTVESLLRSGMEREAVKPARKISPLPTYQAGRCFVDVSNREALYNLMEKK